jgi:hypothetical protein
MATDPVERIRAYSHETPLALDLTSTLAQLADVPPSLEAPYLTVGLDWRPQGTEPGRIPPPPPLRSQRREERDDTGTPRRPSWQQVQRDLGDLVERAGPRGAAFESLSADVARITSFIETELDPAAQGVVFVACDAQQVFAALPLSVPVPTNIATGPIPSLRPLVQATTDRPPYAVLVADQRGAFLWLFERQAWQRALELAADGYPRKQQQGGWSQKRYQSRADVRVEAFAKTIAEETRRELDAPEMRSAPLIIAADEPMASALDAELHETIAARVIGHLHLPVETEVSEVAATAEPLVDEAERQREMASIQALRDGRGPGGKAVVGAEETLTALETGQVLKLIINDDLSTPAWADFTLPVYGVGEPPAEHPAGGDVANMVPVPIGDLAIRLAVQSDADVELVRTAAPLSEEELTQIPDASAPLPRTEAALALDGLGGIGALLRFTLAPEQSTAKL